MSAQEHDRNRAIDDQLVHEGFDAYPRWRARSAEVWKVDRCRASATARAAGTAFGHDRAALDRDSRPRVFKGRLAEPLMP